MPGLLDGLTEAQRKAVTHVEGPLLVVAGAGSGKTRVVTRRVAYLIEQGARPYQIAAITFTNKAANEMKERVEQLCAATGAWVMTFHSMCARILRQVRDVPGHDPRFTIYDASDSAQCVKQALADLGLSAENYRPGGIASSISNAKNQLLTPEAYEATASDHYENTVARVYAKYQATLASNNALDFDDLLGRLAMLWRQHADLRAHWQNRFQFVLIDEYQDTNRTQYVLAKLLTETHHNLCATGDPDQSIYRWRGADINNILSFEKDHPNAKVVKLEQNYRSTKTILFAASEVIKNNAARLDKELWTENEQGAPIQVIRCDGERGEAAVVAEEIQKHLSGGGSRSDVAVFYRTNAQSRSLETALRQANIPYAIVGGVEFYSRKEIRDLIAYLRTCANERDDLALQRIINVPSRGISKTTVEALRSACAPTESLWEAATRCESVPSLTTRAQRSARAFVELMERIRDFPQYPVADFIRNLLEVTNYLAIFSGKKDEAEREANVSQFVAAGAEYDETHPEGALAGFLEEIALVSDIDGWDEKAETVNLMTLHSAKGLEFPLVVITGVEEGLLPHENSSGSDAEIEEERRLLYVGITRAKKQLALTHATSRMIRGMTSARYPSPFLAEIPESAIEESDRTWGSEEMTQPDGDYDSDITYDYEPEEGLPVGAPVRHPKFGYGQVVSVSGAGEKLKVTVNFHLEGPKTLMLAYAPLERV